MTTGIEWTDETWNFVVGCSIVSAGCTHCYAMQMARRLEAMGVEHYKGLTRMSGGRAVWTGKVQAAPEHVWTKPLRWNQSKMIFPNSMSDMFHERIPFDLIDRAYAVMAITPRHIYQPLTKRSKRMMQYLNADRRDEINSHAGTMMHFDAMPTLEQWPPANIWHGVSAEDQPTADERIDDLMATPSAVRWISAEPLLGPLDIHRWTLGLDVGYPARCANCGKGHGFTRCPNTGGIAKQSPEHGCDQFVRVNGSGGIDWVVVGGESGNGSRPMNPMWVLALKDQCDRAGVPFHLKQWGDWIAYEHFGACGWNFTREKDGKRLGRLSFKEWEDPDPSSKEYETRYPWNTGQDTGPCMVRVGKKAAGRKLFGKVYDAYPATPMSNS